MRCVYKYALERTGLTVLYLPEGARVVHAAAQGAGAFVWALVDPDMPTERRAFTWAYTGETVPDYVEHVGTFILNSSNDFVLHVFEVNQ